MNYLQQFWSGIIDSLRIPDAFITISMDSELRWLNIKCFVLNGLIYLGTILVYKTLTGMLSYYGVGSDTETDLATTK